MSEPQVESSSLDQNPVVAGSHRRTNPLAIAGMFATLAVALFLFLNAARLERAPTLVAPSGSASQLEPPPPLDLPKPVVAPAPVVEPAVTAVAPLPPPPPPPAPPPVPPQPDDSLQRLHAPVVVVDLQPTRSSAISEPSAASGPLKPDSKSEIAQLASSPMNGPAPDSSGSRALGPNEQFAAGLQQRSSEASLATQMANLRTTVAQGSTIQALLETALNSDLPGYVRAVVRRDVLGFDGKQVLIPRGSRVIGQYRNAVSLGQSRVFVIWTRVIRPDGVTVQISSPGGDSLGEGGLAGEVNTHFFARFGGAILLSVLNAGAGAVARAPTTEIAIGSPGAAASAAAAATFPQGDIPPTIQVEQGSPVTIFVARDLDFSAVNPIP